MRYRPGSLVLAALATTAFVAVAIDRPAFSDVPGVPGTEVTLTVERISPLSGRETATPRYRCSAKVLRSGSGEVLAEPRLETPEDKLASVSSTSESGIRVAFQVLVRAPNQLTYELQVVSPGATPERHRATIALPQ